ncbi:hypothetical protein [Tunicatimonas pelagia]|uniref:hypothetical protein n=1 Tax=Tunicatimonas pelagia TaxID=931531 RepID=UPI0026664DB7|nr:hypothetical protein [Tunicatimonas pelagia]WKN40770.1 hypothetical protein P0M28_17170 [Tunicatimonas pelagia]
MSTINLLTFTVFSVVSVLCGSIWAQSLEINYSGVVFDNDDHRDTYTEEMLILAEHLGVLDLKAIITTYQHSEYPEFVRGREEIRKKAKQAELKVDYELFSGANETLTVPSSGKIKDTKPLDIDGSLFIVSEAKKASPTQPLAILTGGQLTSVANAYLLDSTIADQIIVLGLFGAPKIDYNANLDSWAWTIILAKMKVISFKFREDNGDFGKAFLQMPSVPKDRLQEVLPGNAFTQWMIDKRHPSQEILQQDADGNALATLLSDKYITDYQRWSFQKVDPDNHHPIMILDQKGKVHEILSANKEIGTKTYWQILTSYAQIN